MNFTAIFITAPCSSLSGSNIENWHSIMRKGLINASGTKYQVMIRCTLAILLVIFISDNMIVQLHGAAYGKGIYLSPLSSVSFGYTGYGRQPGKPKVSRFVIFKLSY